MRGHHLIRLVLVVVSLAVPGVAQTGAQQNTADTAGRASTFKINTRLVTLELVVKDSKGKHISGLKPDDFQLLEQTPSEGKEKREQKIAEFREVHVKDLAPAAAPVSHAASGV